jgi:hypothetical protein
MWYGTAVVVVAAAGEHRLQHPRRRCDGKARGRRPAARRRAWCRRLRRTWRLVRRPDNEAGVLVGHGHGPLSAMYACAPALVFAGCQWVGPVARATELKPHPVRDIVDDRGAGLMFNGPLAPSRSSRHQRRRNTAQR